MFKQRLANLPANRHDRIQGAERVLKDKPDFFAANPVYLRFG
jgi:hypothetical protein